MKRTKIKLMLGMLLLLALGMVTVNAQPNRDANLSKAVEHRIDNLAVLIGEKADSGMDVRNAENMLLNAIDLYEDGNYEDAMAKLDDVEKSIGLEPKRFDRNRQDNMGQRPMGENRPMDGKPMMDMKELTPEEKVTMKKEVLGMIDKLKSNVEKGNYDDAEQLMREIHMRLFRLSGKRPPMGPGQGGPGQGGPGMGSGGNNRDGNKNMNNRPYHKINLDRFFERLKDKGPEGFSKATDIFKKIADKLESKGRDVREARTLCDKAIKQNAAGGFEGALKTLRSAFESLLEKIKPGDMDGDGMNLEKIFNPDNSGSAPPKAKPKK